MSKKTQTPAPRPAPSSRQAPAPQAPVEDAQAALFEAISYPLTEEEAQPAPAPESNGDAPEGPQVPEVQPPAPDCASLLSGIYGPNWEAEVSRLARVVPPSIQEAAAALLSGGGFAPTDRTDFPLTDGQGLMDLFDVIIALTHETPEGLVHARAVWEHVTRRGAVAASRDFLHGAAIAFRARHS